MKSSAVGSKLQQQIPRSYGREEGRVRRRRDRREQRKRVDSEASSDKEREILVGRRRRHNIIDLSDCFGTEANANRRRGEKTRESVVGGFVGGVERKD